MNSEIKFTILAGTVLFIVIGVFLVVFLLQYQKRKFRHQNELMKLRESISETILKSQLEIKEQTLKNISQEIHDNIGQALSLVKLNLGTTDLNDAITAQQKMEDSRLLVAKAIQDLRDLSKSIDTDQISQSGLARSLEYELDLVRRTGAFEIVYEITGTVHRFEPQKELILFRIIQEALNNMVKHAKASLVMVKLVYMEDGLTINLTDNGIGTDLGSYPDPKIAASGMGIRNMINRAQLIGAEMLMESKPGSGTKIKINLSV